MRSFAKMYQSRSINLKIIVSWRVQQSCSSHQDPEFCWRKWTSISNHHIPSPVFSIYKNDKISWMAKPRTNSIFEPSPSLNIPKQVLKLCIWLDIAFDNYRDNNGKYTKHIFNRSSSSRAQKIFQIPKIYPQKLCKYAHRETILYGTF